MQSTPAAPGPGHNHPPISAVLSERYEGLASKIEALARQANGAPRKIETDADLDRVGTIIRDARDLSRETDAARVAEKEPFLKGGREVDGFFKVHADRIGRIDQCFRRIGDDHARKLAQEARKKAEDDARRAREEEQRRIELREKAEADNRIKHAAAHAVAAEDAATRAAEAEALAKASAADTVRQHTASGITASARTEWAFEIVAFDAVPLDALKPYFKRDAIDAAIRLAVRQGIRDLPGVRIFEDVKSSFR